MEGSIALLPESVADLDLDAGVDAGVAVPEGRRGDVDCVDADVDGAFFRGEKVHASSALGREIEYRCTARCAMRDKLVRRELVGGLDEAAGALKPGLEVARSGEEVPAENDWGDADAVVGSATVRAGEVATAGAARVKERCLVRRGSVGLPEGHDVGGVLKLASENAGMEDRGEDLAAFDTGGEEVEVVAVAEAKASVEERAELEALVFANLGRRVVGDGGDAATVDGGGNFIGGLRMRIRRSLAGCLSCYSTGRGQ